MMPNIKDSYKNLDSADQYLILSLVSKAMELEDKVEDIEEKTIRRIATRLLAHRERRARRIVLGLLPLDKQ